MIVRSGCQLKCENSMSSYLLVMVPAGQDHVDSAIRTGFGISELKATDEGLGGWASTLMINDIVVEKHLQPFIYGE